MLRSIGADRVIDYRQEDFTQNGELYDVIFDVVGKRSFARCQGSLTPEGLYISANPRIGVMARGLWHRGKQRIITGVASYKPAEVALLRELLEAGTVKPFIDRSYALDQVADAHRYVDTGEKKGSLVITVVPA
jgi:NADPH2:quinone reductase